MNIENNILIILFNVFFLFIIINHILKNIFNVVENFSDEEYEEYELSISSNNDILNNNKSLLKILKNKLNNISNSIKKNTKQIKENTKANNDSEKALDGDDDIDNSKACNKFPEAC